MPDTTPAPLTDERLAAIRARLDAASPLPWDRRPLGRYLTSIVAREDDEGAAVVIGEVCQPNGESNAVLIANAPADLAALLCEIERLKRNGTEALSIARTEIGRLRADLENARDWQARHDRAGLLVMTNTRVLELNAAEAERDQLRKELGAERARAAQAVRGLASEWGFDFPSRVKDELLARLAEHPGEPAQPNTCGHLTTCSGCGRIVCDEQCFDNTADLCWSCVGGEEPAKEAEHAD